MDSEYVSASEDVIGDKVLEPHWPFTAPRSNPERQPPSSARLTYRRTNALPGRSAAAASSEIYVIILDGLQLFAPPPSRPRRSSTGGEKGRGG